MGVEMRPFVAPLRRAVPALGAHPHCSGRRARQNLHPEIIGTFRPDLERFPYRSVTQPSEGQHGRPEDEARIGGKMKRTSGNMILMGSFAAFSRAHARRRCEPPWPEI